jgi:hypothetical protein
MPSSFSLHVGASRFCGVSLGILTDWLILENTYAVILLQILSKPICAIASYYFVRMSEINVNFVSFSWSASL